MKRWALLILSLLLLGAVVSIAVAWSIWLRRPPPGASLTLPPDAGRWREARGRDSWNRGRSDDWPAEPEWWWEQASPGLRSQSFSYVTIGPSFVVSTETGPRESHSPRELYSVWRIDCGWPARCLTLERSFRIGPARQMSVKTHRGWRIGRRHVPLRPAWPSFIVNTLFYAALLSLPVVGATFGRRALRSKRGRCIRCGYDLRGEVDRGCPECGWRREASSRFDDRP